MHVWKVITNSVLNRPTSSLLSIVYLFGEIYWWMDQYGSDINRHFDIHPSRALLDEFISQLSPQFQQTQYPNIPILQIDVPISQFQWPISTHFLWCPNIPIWSTRTHDCTFKLLFTAGPQTCWWSLITALSNEQSTILFLIVHVFTSLTVSWWKLYCFV